MVSKVFSLNVESSANKFQEQLEEAADLVIQRLEERINYLEDVLEIADAKILNLDEKIRKINAILEKEIKENFEVPIQTISNSIDSKIEEAKTSNEDINHIAIPLKDETISGTDNYKETARKNKRDSVLALADQGYNSIEIAKITGISKSEIILLLQLNKR